jgi:type VI protein secretion system component Hcp
MTYSVYIDFEHQKIKADNPIEAKKKAIKMIAQNKAQLIRVVENESETLEHEVLNGQISY